MIGSLGAISWVDVPTAKRRVDSERPERDTTTTMMRRRRGPSVREDNNGRMNRLCVQQ